MGVRRAGGLNEHHTAQSTWRTGDPVLDRRPLIVRVAKVPKADGTVV
jgi:hypothetical protein